MQLENICKSKNKACLNKSPPDSMLCNKIHGELSGSFVKDSKISLFFMIRIENMYNIAFREILIQLFFNKVIDKHCFLIQMES